MSENTAGETNTPVETKEKKKGSCLITGLIVLGVIVLILVVLGIFVYRRLKVTYDQYLNDTAAKQVEIIGEEIPDFTVTTTDGEDVTLSELVATHEVTVLNIFTSWCGPCKKEFPAMQQVYEKYPDKIAILALSDEEDDTLDVLTKYKQDLGLTFMVARKEGKAESIPLGGYPTSVILDRNGKVVFCQSGTMPEEDIVEKLYTSFMGDDYDGSPVFMYTAIVLSGKDPVEGAVLKFTSDGDTQEATTDAEGLCVIMVNSPAKYTVTIESVPEGYPNKSEESTVGPQSGWAILSVE